MGFSSSSPQIVRSLVFSVLFWFSQSVTWGTIFTWPTGGANPTWASPPASGTTETQDYFTPTGQGIAVSVFNSGQTWQSTALGGAANYPLVETNATQTANGDPTGGATTNGLILYVNNTANVTTNYVQVTIAFNYTGGANAISFKLWDVDQAGNFTDQISNISATQFGGGTVYPTTLTGSANNAVAGSGAGATVTGNGTNTNNSNKGNVTIGFTQTVTSVTFRWSNNLAGGTTQAIGIGEITFAGQGTAFPEIGSATAALALCGGLVCLGRSRQRRPVCAVSGV